MNKTKRLTILLMPLFALTVSSCDLGIDPNAANSISAVLAVLGEYLLAIFSIALVFVFHLTRSLSVSLILLSVLGITNAVTLPVSPYIVLAIGVLLLFSFIVHVKAYSPKVIIDKNVKKVFEKERGKEKPIWKEVAIDIVVGVILLFVEFLIFK